MDRLFGNDYDRRLDEHIKDEFKKVLKPSHPCEFQKQNCFKGSACPLIGLPNDVCIYHTRGYCKFSPCRYKHDYSYSNVYKSAKEKFKEAERKPWAVLRRYQRRFLPFFIWFIGLLFSYLLRRFFDFLGKKIF